MTDTERLDELVERMAHAIESELRCNRQATLETAARAAVEVYLAQAADEIAALRRALEPFATVAALDIGETEADEDHYRNAAREYAKAPPISVGDIRRAREALASSQNPAREGVER